MTTDLIVPDEVQEILNRAPVKLNLISSHEYVTENRLRYVTSPNIFEPNSRRFHPNGLFSEEIFGNITSMDRFATEAAIALNTRIIHPVIFDSNIKAKSLYTGIMNGKIYATFSLDDFSFKLADASTRDAGTGYQFFMTKLQLLADAPEPKALRASNLHKLLVKFNDRLTITELICLPAGLRDLDLKSARLSKDDINKLYMAVINLATSLSSYQLSEDPIFDGIRYQLQLRVADVYEYLKNVISGKGGFIQKHYGARKIAYSTRNIISVPISDADTPESSSNIKSDETMVPMLNLIKCFQPFFTNYVLKKLYGELFLHGSGENVPATNTENLSLEYITLKSSEINRYTTSDGVNRIINQFKHVGFRESPISIRNMAGKTYWLLLVYRDHGKVFLGKTKDDLKRMVEHDHLTFDIKKVDALRWTEALYLAGLNISNGKHVVVTRYPVFGDGSIYPSKIHVITTNPSIEVEVIFDTGLRATVPHYPVLGNPYYESVVVHQSRLQGLGADFDGDSISLSAIWTEEGNAEIVNNLDSISSVIGADMKLKLRTGTDIVKLVIRNLSRQDLSS